MIKLKDLLKESTVRLSTHKDAIFSSGMVQLLGKKGKVGLDKKSVHQLAKIIRSQSKGSGMGWSFTQHEGINEDGKTCWKGYEQIGMKEKDGRQVPNCVPIKEGNLNEASATLPNGVKVKIDFKGLTLQSKGNPVFLDRGEMMTFFKATARYLK